MSVLGKYSREMSATHLIETYCLPTMLYGCEVWTLSDSSSYKISIHGTIVLDVFLSVVGERVSNLFNTFVTHCPYRY